MEDQPSGSIQLPQKGILDRILTVLNIRQSQTSAEYGARPTMENGDECAET